MKSFILTTAFIVAASATVSAKTNTTKVLANGYPYTQVPFTSVNLAHNSFWGARLQAAREVTVPLAFSKCESEHRYKNFDMAAYTLKHPEHPGLKTPKWDVAKIMGFSFDDTDVYKTIEGASYILQTYPDKKLKAYIDSVLNIVAAAQEPDGYLYTARTINPEHPHGWSGKKRWEKEEDLSHELYNLGHMVDAACAHYQATGSRKFLDIARRYADCVCREVGSGSGQTTVVPGHQIAEMALARLYTLTGEKRYLDEAKYLLDFRGNTNFRKEYSQSHKPILEQDEAVGHAVRAGYMYAGIADVAALTQDSAYIKTVDRIWQNIYGKKVYLTGGVGALHWGEAFGKNYEFTDIRNGLVAAIAINVEEPMFESQTKIKLGSLQMSPGGESINKYVGDFVKLEVDNFLHIHADVAEVMQQKITESERERKAMAGVTKLARERAKKANLHNRKLRDCRIHYSDTKNDRKEESSIFITEGDSASGSITKSRDVNTQAVFSLRGKPLNSYGLTKKVVYENEEFNLLQAALDIEEGLDTLRYNKVIVATDADVDGMHIRLLIITFFLQFFPDLIKKGHVFVLQTPLFRVRNRRTKIRNKAVIAAADERLTGKEKKSDFITRYCYSEDERLKAIKDLGPDPEITRFKGLGEISPDEFVHFIGPDMRLEQVTLHKNDQVQKLLEYYMGKNTMERQNFIIDNLVVEEDLPEENVIEE